MTMTLNQIRRETREVKKEAKLKERHILTSSSRPELIYRFIVKYKSEHDGNSPSIREIGLEVRVSSTSLITYYLKNLEKRGLIRRREPAIGHRFATQIEVVGGKWTKEN